LRFSPIDSYKLASCGRENIRFWRIKNGHIPGSAVVLNHHARNTIFTSLDFEFGFKSSDPVENESLKRLFVASKHGMVMQINYHTQALEGAFQLHDAGIYSISVNEAFCVTGSEDQFLRVWPLDFTEFFMEAKHEGTVSAVDISSDGL
jgi:WD40 repeat protein